MIYLDSAATSLLKPKAVTIAMERALHTMASPSRGSYREAMAAAETVYACREAAAELFDTESEQVVFTMNATHALNLAIHSLVKPGMRVLISGYEHNAVWRPLIAAGADITIARFPLFDREAALRVFREKLKNADVVVCTHVSNVFGFVLPIEELARACAEERVPLIVDASQSAGSLNLSLKKWNCAFIAMPGHKGLMGPQGTGLLLCNHDTLPLLYGGTGADSRNPAMPASLPERLEAGTMNVPGIAGLLEGLRFLQLTGIEDTRRKERRLLELFADTLGNTEAKLYFSENAYVQCSVLSLVPRKLDCEAAAERMARKGIAARSGLHCAPLAHETAGTIETGTLRMSFSPLLTEGEVREAGKTLREILKNSDSL